MLDAAGRLFRGKGYEATSLQDLMEATGLGKGSLYGAFGDKHRLYLLTFDIYCEDVPAASRATLADPGRAVDSIRAALLGVSEVPPGAPDRLTCFLAQATAELADRDPEVASRALAAFTTLEELLIDAVRRAQSEGDVDPAADAEDLGGLLLAAHRGAEALAEAGVDPARLRRVAEAAMAALPAPSRGV